MNDFILYIDLFTNRSAVNWLRQDIKIIKKFKSEVSDARIVNRVKGILLSFLNLVQYSE